VSTEPLHTLLKAFGSSFDALDHASLPALVPYFEYVALPAGTVLWEKDDPPNGLYIIQSGVLRASYKFAEHTPIIEESMVSGTLAGELSALSGLPRNARVVVERDAVLWRLAAESMKRLEEEDPHLAQRFVRLVLKGACGAHRGRSCALTLVCRNSRQGRYGYAPCGARHEMTHNRDGVHECTSHIYTVIYSNRGCLLLVESKKCMIQRGFLG
jgi:hypothetical protein